MRFTALFLAVLALASIFQVEAGWNVSEAVAESVMSGISFGSELEGYISGGDNSVGSQILKTTDGGNSWEQVPMAHNLFMLLAINSASSESSVVSGISFTGLPLDISTDGTVFNVSTTKATGLGTSQSVANGNQAGFYGVTGQFGNANGVAVSSDFGKSWTVMDDGFGTSVPTRYGAFPSAQNFVVAHGSWPNNNNNIEQQEGVVSHAFSRFINIHLGKSEKKGMSLEYVNTARRAAPAPAPASNSTWAAVIRQFDGQQWRTTFENNTFYFNQVACPTVDTCYAVGENDNYAFIYKTSNGGQSWNEIYAFEGVSLMAVYCFDADVCWFGGGEYDINFTGHAFYTEDGAATLEDHQYPGYYFNDFSFVSPTKGYATAFNALQQSSLLTYDA